MRVTNEIVFNAADASVTQTSNAFSVNQVYGWAAQFVFTSTATGNLKVQVSCDPGSNAPGDANAPTNWTDMANSSQSITGAGTAVYNVTLGFYNYIRFVYTAVSGTGTVTGRLNLKGY